MPDAVKPPTCPCHVCGLTVFEWDGEMERHWCEGCGEYQSYAPIHPARIAFDTRTPSTTASTEGATEVLVVLNAALDKLWWITRGGAFEPTAFALDAEEKILMAMDILRQPAPSASTEGAK